MKRESQVAFDLMRCRNCMLTSCRGYDPSKVFHRKVNKRVLPTYYDVIKEPMALSTIKVSDARVIVNLR